MKILIMGFGKLKFMPYMNFYLDNLNREKHDIHLLCWNRDLKPDISTDSADITIHEFRCYQEDDVPKIQKIKSFVKYRRFAIDLLKRERFDFLVIVHSLTGIVVWDYIRKHYKNNFIFDFRDVTFEKLSPFRKIVGKMVKFSRFSFVSSDSFRQFLPQEEKDKIYTSHNIDMNALSHCENTASRKAGAEIRVAFWGFIRDEKLNRKVLDCLGNDSRFELHYYGREQQTGLSLKKYALENKLQNIFFHGEYNPDDKYEFTKNVDLIHNIYDDNGAMLAVGNKYYDGIIFGIPQVCMEGSYMGELCKINNIGFECNPYNNDFAHTLFTEFYRIKNSDIKENCSKALAEILHDNQRNIFLIKNL